MVLECLGKLVEAFLHNFSLQIECRKICFFAYIFSVFSFFFQCYNLDVDDIFLKIVEMHWMYQ